MKCVNCDIEIPPIFVAAINSNTCPSCGKNILTEQGMTLLSELREAIAKMPNDPNGLAGWLLSNYHLEKFGTAEPVEFKTAKLIPQERLNQLKKHTMIDKVSEKYKNLLEEINKSDQQEISNEQIMLNKEDEENAKYFQTSDESISVSEKYEIQNAVDSVFKDTKSNALTISDLKKMQLQEQIGSGSIGKIRRR